MLPLVFALAIVLVVLGWPRGAAAWLLAAIATLATMLVLKVLAVACGPPELRSPSGHTATAAFIVGGFAALLARRAGRGALPVLFAGGVAALLIGISRLALGMHTWVEVTAGAAIGCVGALGLYWLAGPVPSRLTFRWVVATALCVVVAFHGLHLNAEPRIRSSALLWALRLGVCRGAPSALAAPPPGRGLRLGPANATIAAAPNRSESGK